MSAPESTRPETTAADLFVGDSPDGDNAEALTRSFTERGVIRSGIKGLRHLSGSASRALTRELAEVVLKSLDVVDLKDLLVGGWRKYKDLTDAAVRTLAAAGTQELVALAAHRIVSTHQPSVDLIVKDINVHTIVFDLTVAFDVSGVLAVVREGKLAALRGGTCLITGELALGEAPLLPPVERRVDLAKFVTLKPAVRLLDEAATRSAAQSVPT
ncbi:MAG: hypothetical protein ACRDRV_16950 [Pseudonocardiaceae bacterium]